MLLLCLIFLTFLPFGEPINEELLGDDSLLQYGGLEDDFESAVGGLLNDMDPYGLDDIFNAKHVDEDDEEIAVGDYGDENIQDYNDDAQDEEPVRSVNKNENLDFMNDFDEKDLDDLDHDLDGLDKKLTVENEDDMGHLSLKLSENAAGVFRMSESGVGGKKEDSKKAEQKSAPADKKVVLSATKSCVANGLWCKCGFQSLFWAYERISDGSKDCYTLEGMCQTCGIAERITAVGFDYRYEKEGGRDVYSFRTKMQGENWWKQPKYAYQCSPGMAVQGVKTKYTRREKEGNRDIYALQIKCGEVKTKTPAERIPIDGLTWYNCLTKEMWSNAKTEWCALNGFTPEGTKSNSTEKTETTSPANAATTAAGAETTSAPAETTTEASSKSSAAPGPWVVKLAMTQKFLGVTDCKAQGEKIGEANAKIFDVPKKQITVTPGEGCSSRRLLRRLSDEAALNQAKDQNKELSFDVTVLFKPKEGEKARQASGLSEEDLKGKLVTAVASIPELASVTVVKSSKPAVTTERPSASSKAPDTTMAPSAAEITKEAAETTGAASSEAAETTKGAEADQKAQTQAAEATKTMPSKAAETTGAVTSEKAETTKAAEETTKEADTTKPAESAHTTKAADDSADTTKPAEDTTSPATSAAAATTQSEVEGKLPCSMWCAKNHKMGDKWEDICKGRACKGCQECQAPATTATPSKGAETTGAASSETAETTGAATSEAAKTTGAASSEAAETTGAESSETAKTTGAATSEASETTEASDTTAAPKSSEAAASSEAAETTGAAAETTGIEAASSQAASSEAADTTAAPSKGAETTGAVSSEAAETTGAASSEAAKSTGAAETTGGAEKGSEAAATTEAPKGKKTPQPGQKQTKEEPGNETKEEPGKQAKKEPGTEKEKGKGKVKGGKQQKKEKSDKKQKKQKPKKGEKPGKKQQKEKEPKEGNDEAKGEKEEKENVKKGDKKAEAKGKAVKKAKEAAPKADDKKGGKKEEAKKAADAKKEAEDEKKKKEEKLKKCKTKRGRQCETCISNLKICRRGIKTPEACAAKAKQKGQEFTWCGDGVESQLSMHDVKHVKTPEGEDSGKSCKEAFTELQEATKEFLKSCPPSLQIQCPAYCNSAEVTGFDVEVAALDQTIQFDQRYRGILLFTSALAIFLLLIAMYYFCFQRGDKVEVEYLLLEHDEMENYIDEF